MVSERLTNDIIHRIYLLVRLCVIIMLFIPQSCSSLSVFLYMYVFLYMWKSLNLWNTNPCIAFLISIHVPIIIVCHIDITNSTSRQEEDV